MHEPEALPTRLRRETASLHRSVEAATGLPGIVRSRSDYVSLLHRLLAFHRAAERRLTDPRWVHRWSGVGIDVLQHRRVHLLERDLAELQVEAPRDAPDLTGIDDFAGALGCLYVVEGSALGGRVIGPAIRSTIGDVPTSFFESAERNHPSPWRSLKDALVRFGADDDGDAVVAGARSTFQAFERHVGTPSTETVVA